MDSNRIRNFCIIAHIDHGKSTLADRLLEYTGTIDRRVMTDQILDQMDLEKERGITIKLTAVRLEYRAADGQLYHLNLIDTPGHVDFNYEVSRSLAACEGALLVVDSTQGVEAQTLANAYLAIDQNLEIIPVINKIDLPSADIPKVKQEIENVVGLDSSEAILTSAKTGEGTEEILEAIVKRIPPPKGDASAPLRTLIFDSNFDNYRGAVPYIRVMDGTVRVGSRIRMMSSGLEFEVDELGVFCPNRKPVEELAAGQVGYLMAGIRNVGDTRVGDTITDAEMPADTPLPGYKQVKPMVFCGLFPTENQAYGDLRDALAKLQLNDAALVYEPETSQALGFGFRCGFLGLLHMEIVQERLEREYGLELITSAPSVVYRVVQTNGQITHVDNPSLMPPPTKISHLEEPVVKATILVPSGYVGSVMELAQERRGTFISMDYVGEARVLMTYRLPLSEIIYDFFNQLKARSRGYASLDYEFVGYEKADLVRLDILINGELVDALSSIVHSESAYRKGRELTVKLRSLIPRQLFEVPIQAAIGSKIIARESVKAMRKDVLAKCYGGDITRKRKLLEKQKEGKKRMKQVGNVEIPQEAFMAVLRLEK